MMNFLGQIPVKVSRPKGISMGFIATLENCPSVCLSIYPGCSRVPFQTNSWVFSLQNVDVGLIRSSHSRVQTNVVIAAPHKHGNPAEWKPQDKIHILAMEFIPGVTLLGYLTSYGKQWQNCYSQDKMCFPFLLTVLQEISLLGIQAINIFTAQQGALQNGTVEEMLQLVKQCSLYVGVSVRLREAIKPLH